MPHEKVRIKYPINRLIKLIFVLHVPTHKMLFYSDKHQKLIDEIYQFCKHYNLAMCVI